MEEFDYTKVIAELISSNIESLFDSSKTFLSDKTQKVKIRLRRTFTEYVNSLKRRYSTTKTIIYRDTPQSIEKFYEPLDLYNDTTDLPNPKIQDLLDLEKPIIITGTGGSGKSTILKYLLLNSLKNTKLIPVFIELRDLESNQTNLLDYITNSIQLKNVDLDSKYLDLAFSKGNFIFFLDGFDELSNKFASIISEEIEQLTFEYPACNFIVTSRPGQEFISWNNFIELKTKPLTLEKAISLIKRLNFDLEVKSKFIEELDSDLYHKHKTFFQNPLLLSIMLITYRDSASIPSELHSFYSLAFEALFYRHDASKAFKRPTLCDLSLSQGKELISIFSLVTYLKSKSSFSKAELQSFLKTTLRLTDIRFEPEEFIRDLLQAYCMLLQDGTIYTFSHRSFQEYFSALYLINANKEKQPKLISEFSRKLETDITLHLAYGMNKELIEDLLIFPFLSQVKTKVKFGKKLSKTSFVKFSRLFFTYGSLRENIPRLSIGSIPRDNVNFDNNIKLIYLLKSRFIIKEYEISTEQLKDLPPFPYMSESPDQSEIPIKEFLNSKQIVDWLYSYSLESRILQKIIEIYFELETKRINKSTVFNELIGK